MHKSKTISAEYIREKKKHPGSDCLSRLKGYSTNLFFTHFGKLSAFVWLLELIASSIIYELPTIRKLKSSSCKTMQEQLNSCSCETVQEQLNSCSCTTVQEQQKSSSCTTLQEPLNSCSCEKFQEQLNSCSCTTVQEQLNSCSCETIQKQLRNSCGKAVQLTCSCERDTKHKYVTDELLKSKIQGLPPG